MNLKELLGADDELMGKIIDEVMKNLAAVALGSNGGKARAKKYSKKQLREWAKKGGRPKKSAQK